MSFGLFKRSRKTVPVLLKLSVSMAFILLCSTVQASDSKYVAGMQNAIIKYLAKGRNFTLTQESTQALGVGYSVPQAGTVADLDGLLNTGEWVELESIFEGQTSSSHISADQNYQIREMYAQYIAAEIAPLLSENQVPVSVFVDTLANSGIVFTVYRERLQQPLDSFGIGIVKQPDNFVAVSTQGLFVGDFRYRPSSADKLDDLMGETGVLQGLAQVFSSHKYTLADQQEVLAGPVLALKLELGRVMENANIAQN